MKFKNVFIILTILIPAIFTNAKNYVWIEGEQPSKSNFSLSVWSGKNPEILSGSKWGTFSVNKDQIKKKVPEEGLILSYDFEIDKNGEYEIWARIGFEWVRAPFEWRIDNGEWNKITPDMQTTNVIEVSKWCEVAWLKLQKCKINKGNHTITLRWKELNKGRLLLGIDCIAITKEKFFPDGKLKPDEIYNSEIDKKARENIFKIEFKNTSERQEFSLNGLWEIARYDDEDMDKNPYQSDKKLPTENEYNLKWRGIEVPSDAWSRPELRFAHRVIYRTKIEIPDEFQNKSFILHFSGTNWIVSVFVNGKFIGWHRSVLVPWDIDISEGIIPGKNLITLLM